jgi:hypothetical protein
VGPGALELDDMELVIGGPDAVEPNAEPKV